MSKLLTVDWDFFFPTPHPDSEEAMWMYDWAQQESRLLIEYIWPTRAAGFLSNDMELPGVEGYDGWWDQFTIAEDATLYIGESHLFAIAPEVREGVDEVWLFDAHHDAGYRGKQSLARGGDLQWECDNWMAWYRQNGVAGKQLHVRYPTWRAWAMDREPAPMYKIDRQVISEHNMPEGVEFDRLYVPRSGAWVPPWCDDEFVAFIEQAPVANIEYASTQPADLLPDVPREFDVDQAREHATMLRDFRHQQLAANHAEPAEEDN